MPLEVILFVEVELLLLRLMEVEPFMLFEGVPGAPGDRFWPRESLESSDVAVGLPELIDTSCLLSPFVAPCCCC